VESSSQSSFAIWITGPPASGKSTLTAALVRQLHELGVDVSVLESDVMRKEFSEHPSYDEQDREYFYRSLAFIGQVLVRHGISVIFDATANRRAYRDRARQHIPHFVEVFVECPFEVCATRDPKGIYRQAREGRAENVPGIRVPYEPPETPDLVVRGDSENPEDAAHRVVDVLTQRGLVSGRRSN
jgi:adenylylsulfate kinase